MIHGIEGDPLVYLNGQMSPLSQAKISVLDRGFIYGDGIYEVVPVYGRKPFRMEQHLNRLERSLGAIRITNPHTRDEWQALVAQLIATMDAPDQFIYLQVTRGVAKRDHAFPVGVTPTVFAMTSKLARPSDKDRTQGLSAVSLVDERWLHCEIKSVSLLGNVLARQYAQDNGVHEVVQFRDGFMTEGSSTNIWMVKNGKVYAPPKNNLVLEGIRYGLIEQLCKDAGVSLEIAPIAQSRVYDADELMCSSATKEILPITQLDGRPVGHGATAGQAGTIYQKLRAGYDAAIARS